MIKKIIVSLMLLVCLFPGTHSFSADRIYQPNWESIDSRPTPQWFSDAKFGIFIHWGVYSVPAWGPVGQYAEWYWNHLTGKKHNGATFDFHVKNYGENFKYQDFAPLFKAELFNPDQWADVFKRSGAKYVVLTSKHHEGFCLWPSPESWNWNSVDIGPHRDLLGDLGNAVRSQGIKMGFYYSLYEWYHPLWLTDKPRFIAEHLHPQFKDVVTRYQPSIIFSDGEWDLTSEEWRSPELLAWLFNESPVKEDVVINDRWGKDCRHKHGGYFTTEYTSGMAGGDHPWEESRGMGFSYGYNRNESADDYKPARELLLMLIDIVSRGGNLLLDIGPTGDGRIPEIMQERLLDMGKWLAVNGEAIYNTRQWRESRQWSAGEIPKVEYGHEYMVKYEIKEVTGAPQGGKAVIEAFFTANQGQLYAIMPRWPGKSFRLKNIALDNNAQVILLGHGKALSWKKSGSDIIIQMPDISLLDWPCPEAFVIKATGVR